MAFRRCAMENLTRIFGVRVPMFLTAGAGVSISEISRIQAEHKQENDTFWGRVSDAIRTVFQPELSFLGGGSSSKELYVAKLQEKDIDAYTGVAKRNARVATLMHSLKLYKSFQAELEHMDLRSFIANPLPELPVSPDGASRGTICSTDKFMDLANIDEMIANLNPVVLEKFEFAFWKKANELNSRAAVLGKLLSEQSAFFRELIKPLPLGERQLTQTGWAITQWKRAYSEEELTSLSGLRDKLQAEYNDLQRQLNGCKKQIKDAVRAYNLEQERAYQSAYGIYRVEAERYHLEMERIRSAAETLRQQALQELAGLKVREE
ncbi:MAG: hypothetical protein KW788_01475 [Candidatus Doudnabacteria bacterium]|nr:hypothetical protein [Candidatus Doudnabacteria bacterium]